MRHLISTFVLAVIASAVQGQNATAPGCSGDTSSATRIDYDAAIPSAAIAMAPWSEVQAHFPEARGITERTVFVTPQRRVIVHRGVGVKATVSKNIEVPAPGTHFRGANGQLIRWIGYEQVPLHTIRIETANERLYYNRTLGEARRSDLSERDRDTIEAMIALDVTAVPIGEREYAGRRCTAKRVPNQGAKAETCVTNIDGWAVALYLQYEVPDAGGLQWYRARRITPHACVATSEISIPEGVPIKERRRKPNNDD